MDFLLFNLMCRTPLSRVAASPNGTSRHSLSNHSPCASLTPPRQHTESASLGPIIPLRLSFSPTPRPLPRCPAGCTAPRRPLLSGRCLFRSILGAIWAYPRRADFARGGSGGDTGAVWLARPCSKRQWTRRGSQTDIDRRERGDYDRVQHGFPHSAHGALSAWLFRPPPPPSILQQLDVSLPPVRHAPAYPHRPGQLVPPRYIRGAGPAAGRRWKVGEDDCADHAE
jgi:hypothetical protein